MQYEKITKLAEANYGEKNIRFLQHFHEQIQMQLIYNVGSFTESLTNA